jgi:hypothetical protein
MQAVGAVLPVVQVVQVEAVMLVPLERRILAAAAVVARQVVAMARLVDRGLLLSNFQQSQNLRGVT